MGNTDLDWLPAQLAVKAFNGRCTAGSKGARHVLALPDDITNAELEQLLFPNKHKTSNQYAEPDYPYIHRELARSGVTLTLLWKNTVRNARKPARSHI